MMLELETFYEKPTLLVWLLYGMESMNSGLPRCRPRPGAGSGRRRLAGS